MDNAAADVCATMERLFECVAAQPAARRGVLGQITGGGASWMSMDPVRRILIHRMDMTLSRRSPSRPAALRTRAARPAGEGAPLYRQIKELLVQGPRRMEARELIPSEIDLAARFSR